MSALKTHRQPFVPTSIPDLFDIRPKPPKSQSASVCPRGSGWLRCLARCAVFHTVLVDVHEVKDLWVTGGAAGQ